MRPGKNEINILIFIKNGIFWKNIWSSLSSLLLLVRLLIYKEHEMPILQFNRQPGQGLTS